MRSLALAQAWKDAGGAVILAAAELPEGLLPRIAAEGVVLSRIDASAGGGREDADETISLAKLMGASWVLIDGDRFESEFLEAVHTAGFKVLLIDDYAQRTFFPVDLIVNPNLDHDAKFYRERGATAPVLAGPAYALLRREFKRWSARTETREKGNKILVTAGGSDPENLTPTIANALATCSDLDVTVIVGPGNLKGDALSEQIARNVHVVFNPPNIAQLMKESDQAITIGGGTLWELLYMGCATFSYSRNAAQRRQLQTLSHRGVIIEMGDTRHFDPEKLSISVRELADSLIARDRMIKLGRNLVDDQGTMRVVTAAVDLDHDRT